MTGHPDNSFLTRRPLLIRESLRETTNFFIYPESILSGVVTGGDRRGLRRPVQSILRCPGRKREEPPTVTNIKTVSTGS